MEAPADPATVRRQRFARTRRRALVGGMITLLALVWLRELTGLPDGPIWFVSLVVIGYMTVVCLLASESTHRYRVDERRHLVRERRRERRLREAAEATEAKRLAAWKALGRSCPECDGEMTPIELFGRIGNHPLHYAEIGSRQQNGAGEPLHSGEVFGEVCVKCTRIVLRGMPY